MQKNTDYFFCVYKMERYKMGLLKKREHIIESRINEG